MKRTTAFNGFFKALKDIKECERISTLDGHDCNVAKRSKMATIRAHKYCKSLVDEHGYQDVHTSNFRRF